MTDLNNPTNELLPEAQDNLYYTPTIEEFRVGFEFCVKQPDNSWLTHIYGEIFSTPKLIQDLLNSNFIRVRCLCHDDIVELGWQKSYSFNEYSTYEFGNKWKDNGGGAIFDFYHNTGMCKITTTDLGYNQDGPNRSIKYFALIKNKSELAFIMERVGIKTK